MQGTQTDQFASDAPAHFGPQSSTVPRDRYRTALAALAEYTRAQFGGRMFQRSAAADQDKVLTGLDKGQNQLRGTSGQAFSLLIQADVVGGVLRQPDRRRQLRTCAAGSSSASRHAI